MKINFGMPECLVTGSFYLFSTNFGFAIFLLSIGILSRLIVFGADEAKKQRDRDMAKEVLSALGTGLSKIMSNVKEPRSSHGNNNFH